MWTGCTEEQGEFVAAAVYEMVLYNIDAESKSIVYSSLALRKCNLVFQQFNGSIEKNKDFKNYNHCFYNLSFRSIAH